MASVLTFAPGSGFAKLWSAQILSQIAQNLLNFALIIRVYDLAAHTGFANLSVSLLILSFAVPSVIFAAVAGIYVDHWDRKYVLVIANLLRAVLVLGYLFVEQNFWLVLALSFVISAVTQFFVPAEAASIPALVPEKSLVSANSLFLFTFYASFIVGYSAAAPVVAAFGAQVPYLLTAAMFGLAGLFSYLLPSLRDKTTSIRFEVVLKQTRKALISNWNTIRGNQNLYFPILELSLTQTMVGVMMVLAPALSLAVLGMKLVSASQILILPAGVGMVVGVAAVGYILKKFTKLKTVSWALLLAGVGLAGLGLVGQLVGTSGLVLIIAAIMFGLGLVNAIISVASQTLLQENTSDANRGQVFGALNMVVNICATVPIFVAGILADIFSVTQVVFAAGVGVLALAIVQLIIVYKKPLTISGS